MSVVHFVFRRSSRQNGPRTCTYTGFQPSAPLPAPRASPPSCLQACLHDNLQQTFLAYPEERGPGPEDPLAVGLMVGALLGIAFCMLVGLLKPPAPTVAEVSPLSLTPPPSECDCMRLRSRYPL